MSCYPSPSVFCVSLSPCPRLRFHFPLSSCLHPSILASLPFTSFRPLVATSLPSSLSFPLSFSCFCLPPSSCPSIPGTFCLCLFVPCPPFPTLSPLFSLNKFTNDMSLAHCISHLCDFSFFCLDSRPYFPFFRDMMRKMLKQMRPEPE